MECLSRGERLGSTLRTTRKWGGGFIAKENEGQGLVNRLTRGGTGIRGILAELAWQNSHCRQARVLATTWWTGRNEELGQIFKMITCRG